MSTASFALLAAITAIFATAVVTVVVLRSRRASERRLTAGLLEVETRMDALVRELTATVERAREDALRARIVESFGQALDLDEILARSVDAAASLHGVAGATATVDIDDERVVAAAGDAVTGDGAAGAVDGPPDGRAVRAVGISYHYATGTDAAALRSAIAVPLESGGRHLGFLTVFGRSEEPPVAGNDFATLEAIAQHAGDALANAQRRREARPAEEAEADPLTGLGNRRALHETLALEVARALRHGGRLAVCAFDLDDFRQTNARIGQIDGDAVLVAVAELIRASLRPGDLAYRSGGDEFAVILPGSGRTDGEALYARLQASLGRIVEAPPVAGVSLSAGIAELKAGDDGVSLYERAERALRRAKAAGKGTAA